MSKHPASTGSPNPASCRASVSPCCVGHGTMVILLHNPEQRQEQSGRGSAIFRPSRWDGGKSTSHRAARLVRRAALRQNDCERCWRERVPQRTARGRRAPRERGYKRSLGSCPETDSRLGTNRPGRAPRERGYERSLGVALITLRDQPPVAEFQRSQYACLSFEWGSRGPRDIRRWS